MDAVDRVLARIRACRICEARLPLGPHPILQASRHSRIAVVSQAPGRKVHESGIPFNDASGRRLRAWMGIDDAAFYDPARVAIIPMGFCFPGTGRNGDLPPRPECAPTWHPQLFPLLTELRLTLLIGHYAIDGMLRERRKRNVTETVRAWREYVAAGYLPLPHPSPRNQLWLKRNPWFAEELVPELQRRVALLLAAP